MFRLRSLWLAAVTALALAAPSHAAQPLPHAAEALFLALDVDGDGRVSADEYLRGAQALFHALDADRDDRLSTAELALAQQRAAEVAHTAAPTEIERLHLVDHGGEAGLARAEHATRVREAFERLDADRDGWLSRGELREALASN